MATEAQKAAKKRYLKRCKQINVIIYPTESDIMARVNDMHDKTGYIKDLIRRDMAEDQREEVYFEETEELSTSDVVAMAVKILEALGEEDRDVTITESRRIVARAMAARDLIIGSKKK